MRTPIGALLRDRVVLLDGAMGSELIEKGLAVGQSPELWNLERPEIVRQVHAAYVAAGSDVVQTNTFGGNPFALARHGLDGLIDEINRAAADIAREAAGPDRLVAGNIGPSGLLLAPLGSAEPADLEAGFGRQAAALAVGGVDYISIETMMDLSEALCALRGALAATRLPVAVCLTFDQKQRGFFTMMGNRPDECMRVLAGEGATAVGANCSIGSDAMVALCPELVTSAEVPVIVKPNAGLPELESGRAVYRQEPVDFAHDMVAMVRSGARAVGGCCGSDARFIAALRAGLDAVAVRDATADGAGRAY